MVDNLLYYGDNLDVIKLHIKDESIDLIYLDPPFNSNASYNVLFTDRGGEKAAAQLKAFKDTWTWAEAASIYQELSLEQGPVGRALRSFHDLLPHGGLLAYLVMIAPRLSELHRVLKPAGSIYVHCDPTASHYLKVLMDAIFGPARFLNEIVWKRTSAHSDVVQGALHLGRIHDIILRYSKGDSPFRNAIYVPYSQEYIEKTYRQVDEDGRRYQTQPLHAKQPGGDTRYEWKGQYPPPGRYWAFSKANMEKLEAEKRIVYSKNGVPRYKIYLDESKGRSIQDLWDDIPAVHTSPSERLGYPTQKPEALLERILKISTNEADVVLDPFCGCGTTVAVAQRLHRQWIGIDITQAAIKLIKERLKDVPYKVIGEPVSIPDAEFLAETQPYQFQWWALGLVGARPAEEKKGADRGIDGRLFFRDEADGGKIKQVILSVKAGHHNIQHVRELRAVVEREKAEIGVLLSMHEPTKNMVAEAADAGFYHSSWWNTNYPRLQILTIAQLLDGKGIDMPLTKHVNVTFKRASLPKRREIPTLPLLNKED